MDDRLLVYAIAGTIAAYLLAHVVTRTFDPFAPNWMFLTGYFQVYVIQPISFRDWAINIRGIDLVTAANWRALWALWLFLAVYHIGVGRRVAPVLPRPPRGWSHVKIAVIAPPLILWGLYCSGIMLKGGLQGPDSISPEEALLRSFPFLMMVAAVLLIVTGRNLAAPRPAYLAVGALTAAAYIVIWMFNGKRSHSLIGVLATVCSLYITRLRRPSWPVLFATSFAGVLVVAISIGWRNNPNYETSFSGFAQYLSEFDPQKMLESLNMVDSEEQGEFVSQETTEYGGFLLMMDTVPMKSDYDYGANYLRTFTTFIPRLVWPTKPIFGRAQWIAAWVAGSEIDREEEFTSPAIGLLGATQLNGGALGTAMVVTCLALILRLAYEYFRLHAEVPWVQFWWAITFYNAWFMVVNDDPMVWFYYNWGFTSCPIVVAMWFACRASRPADATAPGRVTAMA